MFHVHMWYDLRRYVLAFHQWCVGDDPNLVKALVLRQFFFGPGSDVYMSFHVHKVFFFH